MALDWICECQRRKFSWHVDHVIQVREKKKLLKDVGTDLL